MVQGRTLTSMTCDDVERAPLTISSVPNSYWIAQSILLISFSRVIYDLAAYSLRVDLHSHALLIPVISAYLIWQERARLPLPAAKPSSLARALYGASAIPLACFFWLRYQGHSFLVPDYLSFAVSSLYLFVLATFVRFLGRPLAASIAFPLAFLAFIIPFPSLLQGAIEIAAQVASADAFAWFLDLTFITYLRDGQFFYMPGLSIQVAQECSGVRSSLVLFITSLLAGQIFLRSGRRRLLLAAFVFPLAILRNAFRIWTLSVLTIYWDPGIIHSPLHHRGGPVFFVLSLIPFFALLWFLRTVEVRDMKQPEKHEKT